MWHWLKCKLGFHDWDKWEYVSETNCTVFQRCRNCAVLQKAREEPKHQYGEWVWLSDCEAERVCERCDHKETGDNHRWEIVSKTKQTHVEIIYPYPIAVETTRTMLKCTVCSRTKEELSEKIFSVSGW